MSRTLVAAALGLLFAVPAWAAEGASAIKVVAAPPPQELKESIRTLLSDQAVAWQDEKGATVGQIWLRKEVPAKATPEQIKMGLSYRELEESAILGALKLEQQYTDYRRQKIKPGVYTLRLGFQPMDGDHMGTAPYPDFVLMIPAGRDENPDLVKDAKALYKLSTGATGTSHPAVLLLFPNPMPEDKPKLEDKGNGHWVISSKETAVVGGQKAPLGISLTLVGHAPD